MAKVTSNFFAKEALRVYDDMIVIHPQTASESHLSVSKTAAKFPGCYAVNNSTLCFVFDGQVFVAPYTSHLEHLLQDENFREEYFNVPFSNWDYPKYEKAEWEALRAKARKSYAEDFVSDCEAYCDKNGIGSLSDAVLSNCFEMPKEGVYVKHTCFETRYYPIITSTVLDFKAKTKLGHFWANNGKVVFVYRNGKTYVAKGYKIINILASAGYTNTQEYVPFSNNEQILEPELAHHWEEIKKF